MISSTTTITIVPTTHVELKFHQKDLTVKDLIQSISESEILSLHQTEELDKIKTSLSALRDPDNEEMAILFFFIIYHVIYPSLDDANDDDVDKLLEFEDQAKTLLMQYLPKGVHLETYLSQLSREEESIKRLMLIENFFHRQEEILDASAKVVNLKMNEKFELIKEHVIALSMQSESSQGQVNILIENLTRKMKVLLNDSEYLNDEKLKIDKLFQVQQASAKKSSGPKVFK